MRVVGGAWIMSGGPEALVFLVFTVIYSCALWNSHLGFHSESRNTICSVPLGENFDCSVL